MGRHDQMVLDIGEDVGGYRVESFVARGGMAVVYKARDRRLGRPVALKLIAPELASDPTFRARFARESELAASLDHPNVLPIYRAGEIDGMLWTAMRFVDGEDLDTALARRGRLTADETVTVFAAVAAALDAAHARLLVHRDVKPGNVLLTGHDDDAGGMNLAARHVYLTDFGLTKRSADATGLTTAGQFLGTIAYVAPEQIAGGAVDHRADVYSLGCVLFHVLSGAPPFARDDYVAMLWAHITTPPPPLSSAAPDLPVAADAVLQSAMAKDPAGRPESCGALVGQLRTAFGLDQQAPFRLADRPPGREAGVLERFAVEPADEDPTVARVVPEDVPGPVPSLGEVLATRPVPPPPVPPPPVPPAPVPTPPARQAPSASESRRRAIAERNSPPTLLSHRRDPEPAPAARPRRGALLAGLLVLAVAVAGAGFWLSRPDAPGRTGTATASPRPGPGAPSGSLGTPTVVATVSVGAKPQGVAVAPDGSSVYVANSGERSVSVINTEDNRSVTRIPTRDQPQYLVISPDGATLYVATHNDDGSGNTVEVIDTARRTLRTRIRLDQGARSDPYAPALSPDGTLLYVPDHGRSAITVIDTAAAGILMTLPVEASPHWVTFGPDGRTAYVANHESNVLTVVDATKTMVTRKVAVGRSPHGLAVSRDGTRAFTANYDVGTSSIVDLRKASRIRDVPVGANPRCVALSADGRHAYFAATGDDTLTVLDTTTLERTAAVRVGTDPWVIAVSGDGRTGYVSNRESNTVTVLSLTG